MIINSPYEEPEKYWSYHRERRTFSLAGGRRPAGYVIALEGSRSFDAPGHFVERGYPLAWTTRYMLGSDFELPPTSRRYGTGSTCTAF